VIVPESGILYSLYHDDEIIEAAPAVFIRLLFQCSHDDMSGNEPAHQFFILKNENFHFLPQIYFCNFPSIPRDHGGCRKMTSGGSEEIW
jgi:hypothetical protein